MGRSDARSYGEVGEVEEDGEIGSVGRSKKTRGDGVVRSLERLGKAMRLEWLGGWGG